MLSFWFNSIKEIKLQKPDFGTLEEQYVILFWYNPANIYLFKKTIVRLEKVVKYLQSWSRSGVFIVNFEHSSFSIVSTVDFEQVHVSWVSISISFDKTVNSLKIFSGSKSFHQVTLREKYPNTEFFLIRVFLYSDWIQENMDQK